MTDPLIAAMTRVLYVSTRDQHHAIELALTAERAASLAPPSTLPPELSHD